jgi:hypothetical protein
MNKKGYQKPTIEVVDVPYVCLTQTSGESPTTSPGTNRSDYGEAKDIIWE